METPLHNRSLNACVQLYTKQALRELCRAGRLPRERPRPSSLSSEASEPVLGEAPMAKMLARPGLRCKCCLQLPQHCAHRKREDTNSDVRANFACNSYGLVANAVADEPLTILRGRVKDGHLLSKPQQGMQLQAGFLMARTKPFKQEPETMERIIPTQVRPGRVDSTPGRTAHNSGQSISHPNDVQTKSTQQRETSRVKDPLAIIG